MAQQVVFSAARIMVLGCAVGVLSLTVSCSKRGEARSGQPGTNTAALAAADPSRGDGKTLKEMAPDDVIVSVNGVPLTKKQFETNIDATMRRLAKMPKMDRGRLAATAKYMVRVYIPNFVNRQLLIQEARRTDVLSETALSAARDAWIAKQARQSDKTVAAFLEQVPGGPDFLKKEAEESVLVEAMIATNVTPKVAVPEEFVAATIAAIKAENAAVDTTNALRVAWLNTLRGQILAGADFGKLADIHSQCKRSGPGNNGYWGEFERRDIADQKMQEAVFKLKPGEISEVLSDEEGFHLVKMLAYKGAEAKTTAKAPKPETVSLAHILLRREPALEMTVPGDLKKQLFAQQQQKLTAEYVKSLREKAVIDYPNGTNFWPKASQPAGRKLQPPAAGK